jgi:hypothetical protein
VRGLSGGVRGDGGGGVEWGGERGRRGAGVRGRAESNQELVHF